MESLDIPVNLDIHLATTTTSSATVENRLHRNWNFWQSSEKKIDRSTTGRKTIHTFRQGGKQKRRVKLTRYSGRHRKRRCAQLSYPTTCCRWTGKQLAGIINVFNPEMLVIGGEMSATGDYLTLPIRMGIKRFSLNVMNEDSKIVTSELKGQAGVVGACLMARYRLLYA